MLIRTLLISPFFSEILDKLESQSTNCLVQEIDITEPTYDYLESIRSNFVDEKLDAIIGMGGGSALDVAKGIAVLINNKNPAISYRGFDQMTEPVYQSLLFPLLQGQAVKSLLMLRSSIQKKKGS